MTKEIEVIDALPGSGKTTSVFTYMSQHQEKPWLYLSPMKDEVNERVQQEADKVNMVFHIASKEDGTLAPQILEFMKQGNNIACTHALTLHFKKEHIEWIKLQDYRVVCDEELNLIDAFNISKQDIDFLYSENMLSKDLNNLGRMSFLKQDMSDEARYGDIKRLCDRGCLYGEKNSNTMLVTYLSPDLILSSDRFILLTYNFGGSIMDAFLKLHKISNKSLEIPLYRTNNQNKQEIKQLLEFIEPLSVKKFLEKQSKFNLSSSWWEAKNRVTGVNPDDVRKLIVSLQVTQKVPKNNFYFTIPMESLQRIKGMRISSDNLVACNCRATNKLSHKTYAVHAFNIFNNVTVKSYLLSYGYEIDEDSYALNQSIQWVFRGCIRDRKPMKITFLSKRMQELFKNWLQIDTLNTAQLE
jgi:hypothetical protein